MGGEAYDGPPKFEVDFDGKVLGRRHGRGRHRYGRRWAASPTQKDKTPYVQTFTFAIPEDAFRPDGAVTVKFLNEAYGGEGSGRDRNLFLASVSLNGRAITASGLVTRDGRQLVANEMLGEFLVIPDGNRNAVSEPPEGGWPMPLDVVQPVAAKAEASEAMPGRRAAERRTERVLSRRAVGSPSRSKPPRSSPNRKARIAISTRSTMSSGSTRIRTS